MYGPEIKPGNNIVTGIGYFIDGARLLLHPKLRIYLLVPLLVNCVLFILLTSLFLTYLYGVVGSGFSWVPDWLEPWLAPLKWIAWLIFGAIFLMIYGYSFNMITNILAAPFYGLLAENTEKILTGQDIESEPISKMIPRVTFREIQKLIYFLLRGILIILAILMISMIPVIQIIAPFIGLAWGAWSMAIQYADYPADNHQLAFHKLRQCLWQRMYSSLGFGGAIMSCSVVPFVNIFAMPAAVAGGTIYWVNELKRCKAAENQP